jgi:hypothetical protein
MKFNTLAAGLLAASALTGMAGMAVADETTIIHEHHEQPAVMSSTSTERTTEVQAVRTTTTNAAPAHRVRVHRRAVVHHLTVHHLVHRHPVATSWRTAHDTAATVRADTDRAEQNGGTTVDRRTVIHRDDDGNVVRRTRTIRQDQNGMTTVEHRSTEGPPPN